MDFIKYMDCFGINFHFYTNNHPNHQNIFGGIMTFLCLIICCILFSVFSYDDMKRLNPKSAVSEITDIKPRIINIKNEKIYIPFRIVTNENKYIDHRGKLDIFAYFVQGIFDYKIGMDLKYSLLDYKLCNETAMANMTDNYKIDVPLNELFCIENDDISLGGNWNGDFLNYIDINVYLCEEGIYFNIRITELYNNIYSSLSFDFYYPIVQFQPTNIKNPISIVYRNYFYRLSAYSHKLEKIYIQEHILSDDKNLIITNYKNSSYFGTSAIYGDDYFLSTKNDPIIKNKMGQIFTMEIYLDYGLVYYTRTYNKILFIISNFLPLFRFVLYVFQKFTRHIKSSLLKRELAGLIFVNKTVKNIINIDNINDNKKISSQNVKINPIFDNSQEGMNKNIKIIPFIDKKLKFLKKSQKNISLLSNSNLKLNNDIISHNNYNNKLTISLTHENHENSKNINNENENEREIPLMLSNLRAIANKESMKLQNPFVNDKNSEEKNNLFPYHYFILDIFFDKLINPQHFFCIPKVYFTVYNFMSQIYDISTYITIFKQFYLIKNFLKNVYEEKGYYSLPHRKININDKNLIEKINTDLKRNKSLLFSQNIV